jgi:phage terminase large subunit
VRIEFHARWYQRPFHQAFVTQSVKRFIEIAHRRWGKDEVTLAATREQAFKRVGNYWHCLPEYEQARKTLWDGVNAHTGRRRIDEAFPPELRVSKDEQKMFIRLLNGSTWQLMGSDRYDSQVGAGPAGIVYSEWALANPSAWAIHRPMLEENGGWAAFITTPRGKNHAHRMLEHARAHPDRWFSELSTIADTKALTRIQLDEALAEYITLYGEDEGAAHFEQEYFCSFDAAVLGAYYSKQMRRVQADGRIRSIPYDDAVPVHTAWDIGRSDATVIWYYQVVGPEIHLIDYYAANGAEVDEVIHELGSKPWAKRYGRHHLPHDARAKTFASGRSVIEQLAPALGLNSIVIVPNIGVQDGIQAARRALARCWFDQERTEPGIEALRQYQREWDDERKVFRVSPLHNWASDPADAFRMLAVAWAEEPRSAEKGPARLLIVGPENQVTLEDMWGAASKRKVSRI